MDGLKPDEMAKRSQPSIPQVRLIMLGVALSGKTTIIQQLRRLYAGGFDDGERKDLRENIWLYMLAEMQLALKKKEMMRLEFVKEESENFMDTINSASGSLNAVESGDSMNVKFFTQLCHACKGILTDATMQRLLLYEREDDTMFSCFSHFFSDLDRVFALDYLPSDLDITSCYCRSAGITTERFQIPEARLQITSPSGSRSGRKKWPPCLDDMPYDGLLYTVPLTAYCSPIREEDNRNQLRESLLVFQTVIRSSARRERVRCNDIFLILTKLDVFRETFASGMKPFNLYFPEYKGGNKDVIAAQSFVAKMFQEAVDDTRYHLHVRVMNALDINSVRGTFHSLLETLKP